MISVPFPVTYPCAYIGSGGCLRLCCEGLPQVNVVIHLECGVSQWFHTARHCNAKATSKRKDRSRDPPLLPGHAPMGGLLRSSGRHATNFDCTPPVEPFAVCLTIDDGQSHCHICSCCSGVADAPKSMRLFDCAARQRADGGAGAAAGPLPGGFRAGHPSAPAGGHAAAGAPPAGEPPPSICTPLLQAIASELRRALPRGRTPLPCCDHLSAQWLGLGAGGWCSGKGGRRGEVSVAAAPPHRCGSWPAPTPAPAGCPRAVTPLAELLPALQGAADILTWVGRGSGNLSC